MTTKDPDDSMHRYSADRPLEHLSQDRLDRGGFIERLAVDILGWHGKDSLVISLNGEWGSGKTTLKNFLKERLVALGRPVIVEFNPWQWSGQDRVFEAFFAAIKAEFEITDTQKQTERLAERWAAFAAWTKLGATISKNLERAITPLLGTSITGALLANSAATPSIRITGIALGIAGIVLSSFLAIFPEIALHFVEALKVGRRDLSLAELRGEITTQLERLRKEGRTVLVIIDDVDRLSQEEIRLLFQLIKANANFPNMVFLLLFQKNIIVEALSKVVADRGADYLRKIVQVEIDVPHVPRTRMLKIFQEDLNRIFERSPSKMRWDKNRMQRLFEDNLWPYFRTLRDTKRFLGTFDFYYSGHINHGILEVNPIDLLAVEILRTFDHEAFITMRDSLGYSSQGDIVRALMADEEYQKESQRHLDVLLNRTSLKPGEKERLRVVLRNLFPEGKAEQTEFERELRVCHPKHFHKYFEHALDDSPTSVANVEALIRMVSDRPAFVGRLRELCKAGKIEEVFEKLGVYFEGVQASAAAHFVTSLFDVGEELPAEQENLLNQDPVFTACRLIYLLLKKLPSEAEREKILLQCLRDTPGVVLPVTAIAFFQRRIGDGADVVLLDETHLASPRQASLGKLEGMAKSGALWPTRHFANLIRIWREWAGDKPVREWLAIELTTPERKLEFLSKFIGRSMSGTELYSYLFSAKWLEGIVNLDEMEGGLAGVAGKTPLERAAIKSLSLALERKRGGRSYEQIELEPSVVEESGD